MLTKYSLLWNTVVISTFFSFGSIRIDRERKEEKRIKEHDEEKNNLACWPRQTLLSREIVVTCNFRANFLQIRGTANVTESVSETGSLYCRLFRRIRANVHTRK